MKQNILLICGLWALVAKAQLPLSSSNLPLVYINTNGLTILDEPKITADMRIIWNGNGQINRPGDASSHYNGKIGIERRGSTSQDLSDKKPYAVELRDAAGANFNFALLGMPSENDWSFIAPYSDKTLIRDAVTYHLAGSFMAYAPKLRFVELFLNNDYRGVYVITEKIKRDKNRVNISSMAPTDITGDALTGGYIMKIDKLTGASPAGYPLGFNSKIAQGNFRTPYLFHYPDPEDIVPAQRTYIQQQIDAFESVMNSSTFADPTNGYRKFIDITTFADFFIMNELTRNVDGYRLSTYFYKDRNSVDGRFKAGPVWDFNIALGNADYCDGARRIGWAYDFNTVCNGDAWQIPFWMVKLFNERGFRGRVRERWQQLRQNQLSNARVTGLVDSLSGLLSGAQARNFQKWPILGRYVWPNPYVGATYEDEVRNLRNWLTDRISWLDGQINAFPVSTVDLASRVSVYPNPSVSGFTFEYDLPTDGTTIFTFFNAQGQLIAQQNVTQKAGSNQFTWSADVPSGVYFYNIRLNDTQTLTGKLLKN